MCRRISRGSYDIHGVSEDVRAQERRQTLRRDQLDMPPEYRLEEISERYKVLETLLTGYKLDEQIDVAVWPRGVPAHRAEESQAPHAQPENLGSGRTDAGLNI